MITRQEITPRIFRMAAIGLLAGSALFTAAASAQQRSDGAIQSDVTTAISQDSALQGQQISATASTGVVTLNGTVQTEAQRQAAETDAANISGVSGIMNNLKVTNPGSAAPSAGLAAQSSADQLNPQNQSENQDQENQNQPQDQEQTQGAVPPPPPDVNQPEQAPPPPANPPQYQQGYPQQPYQQGYPQQPYRQAYPQQGYNPAPQVPYYPTPTSPVTIAPGTLLRVRVSEPLDTAHVQNGQPFQATAAVDVYEGNILAIPRGATLNGQVVEAKEGGRLAGSGILRLQLSNVNLGGHVYPISSDVWSSRGPNKAGYTARNTVGGALLGAIIGGAVGRGAGAAIGAGAGAAGGLAASSATNGPRVYLPTEAAVDFHLTSPVTVQPVSWQEAQRLASSAPQPVLVRRRRPVYVVPGPYYGPYAYAYPYPY